MGKKSFQTEAPAPVYTSLIPEYMEQEAPDPKDVLEAQEALKTQGKRGMRAPRINLAFTPSNLDYVRTMSKARGISITTLVNELLDRERAANGEKYNQIKELLESL